MRSTEKHLSGLPKWTEATETKCVTEDGDKVRWIDWVVSELVCGNIRALRNYLDRSREAHILIHGVETRTIQYPRKAETAETDDAHQGSSSSSAGDGGVWTSGKTALHLAACEASSEIVQLLLERGADPNARDLDGRFPLAEAALWGRLESVKILLKYGADKNLECVRAGRRLRAVDFARPLLANQKERYNRAGGRHAVYREIAYERDQDRKAIVCLLQDEMDADPNQRSLHGFAFTSDENLLTLIAKFDVPNKLKTIGVLYRGSRLPSVAAMSGWGHHELDDSNVQISRREDLDKRSAPSVRARRRGP